MYLFIDTTQYITIGLLGEDFSWIDYSLVKDKKSSANLHFLIFDMLEKKSIEFEAVKKIIYMAGPGSYTGMRVSQGFVDICRLNGKDIFSLYHFDVPGLTRAYPSGKWFATAFKGEIFIADWNNYHISTKLVKKDDFVEGEELLFTSFAEDETTLSTDKLIFEYSKIIFTEITKTKTQKELFYYRSLDEEYSQS